MNALISFLIVFASLNSFAKNCLEDTSGALQKAQGLRQQSEYLLSTQHFAIAMDFSCNDEQKAQALLGTAQNLYLLGDNLAAEKTVQELGSLTKSPKASSQIIAKSHEGILLKAWYQPEARVQLPDAEKKLFADYEIKAQQIRENHHLKNPWIAGISSAIIPGAGQAYNGNYQSAAFSFIINSLFLAAALELNRKGLQTTSLAAGLMFSVTYTGGILGSVNSANTINRNYAQPFLDEERKQSLPNVQL